MSRYIFYMIKVLINLPVQHYLLFGFFIRFRRRFVSFSDFFVVPIIIDHFSSALPMEKMEESNSLHSLDLRSLYWSESTLLCSLPSNSTFERANNFCGKPKIFRFSPVHRFYQYASPVPYATPFYTRRTPLIFPNHHFLPTFLTRRIEFDVCLFARFLHIFPSEVYLILFYSLENIGPATHFCGHTWCRWLFAYYYCRPSSLLRIYSWMYAILLTHCSAWEVKTHAEPMCTAPRPISSIQSI